MDKIDYKHDWREDLAPLWAVLKPEYKAAARSEDGAWNAYSTESGDAVAGIWKNEGGYWVSLEELNLPTPDCDWKETWTVRPEYTDQGTNND